MQKFYGIIFLGFTLLLAGCSELNQESSSDISKDEARMMGGKNDLGFDLCELFGWYDDGICDDFCPLPDPDCDIEDPLPGDNDQDNPGDDDQDNPGDDDQDNPGDDDQDNPGDDDQDNPGDDEDVTDPDNYTTVTLYFRNPDMDASGPVELTAVERSVPAGDNPARIAIEELIKGPMDGEEADPTIREDAEIIDIFTEDGTCILNISHELPIVGAGGWIAGEVFIYSVTYTLTEIPEIDSVWVFLDDIPWEDGHTAWEGPFTKTDTPQTALLFFADNESVESGIEGEYGFVAPVQRTLSHDFYPLWEVLDMLIEGPDTENPEESTVGRSLPALTEVLSVTPPTLENRTVILNLQNSVTSGTLGGMIFMQSLVYTMTSFPVVDKVLVLENGEAWEDGHWVWDEPIGRNP